MAKNPKLTKKLFRVVGDAEGVGWIDFHKHAYTRAQAIKIVDIELRKLYPGTRVYLGNCEVVEIPEGRR